MKTRKTKKNATTVMRIVWAMTVQMLMLFAISASFAQDECQSGNVKGHAASLDNLLVNVSDVTKNMNQDEPLAISGKVNFELNPKVLAKGNIQMSFYMTDDKDELTAADNEDDVDGVLYDMKKLDVDKIYTSDAAVQLIGSKVAYVLDIDPSKITKEIIDDPKFVKAYYGRDLRGVERKGNSKNEFVSDKVVSKMGITVQMDVTSKHMHKIGDNSDVNNKLIEQLAKFDDEKMGRKPEHVFVMKTTNSTDSRFVGGTQMLKFYRVGNKTLVVTYKVGATDLGVLWNFMTKGKIKSMAFNDETSDQIRYVENFRNFVKKLK
ncbi:MAG: hypothetical protein HQK49_13870 [Oligoflexia bacterium]|nr:hypothetical protein [Oligoflexia bacterium]